MHPILFKLGPLTIYSYGVMMALAFLAVLRLALNEAPLRKIRPMVIYDLAIWLVIGGILGARLAYVVFFDWRYFIVSPWEIIMLHHGGLVFYGGVIGGTLAGGIYIRRRKLSFWKMADLVAPYIVLGHAIGRIGCFLNGCCYGIDNHPTQVYSSLFLVILFIFLRKVSARAKFSGEIFLNWLILYSVFRFLIDFIRGDLPRVIPVGGLSLTVTQLISILIFALSLFIWRSRRAREVI